MEVAGTKPAVMAQRIALLGIADDAAGQQIAREVSRIARMEAMLPVVSTRTAGQVRELCLRFQPAAILLDEALLSGMPLVETVQRLAALAPVVLIAPVDRQTEIAAIVASGEVDFVARTGEFAPLAIGLMERKLRSIRAKSAGAAVWPGFQGDLAEILRHEINNPLTGILGNAEMLLSHRERLPLADAQRLQTVVDLAVRLRETTRRLSNAWESRNESLRSA